MRRITQLASDWFDLPAEVAGTLPRIEWIGQHLQIENFQGVHQFSPEQLTLKTGTKLLTVEGKALVLKTIYPNRILLKGEITAIQVKNKE
jgi:sporulation protein YqfC